MLTKKRSKKFYKPANIHSVTNAVGESISSISTFNIVNQLGKYDFSCGSIVNNLKEMHIFFDQINRNYFDLITLI